jgi:hypothetical protein
MRPGLSRERVYGVLQITWGVLTINAVGDARITVPQQSRNLIQRYAPNGKPRRGRVAKSMGGDAAQTGSTRGSANPSLNGLHRLAAALDDISARGTFPSFLKQWPEFCAYRNDGAPLAPASALQIGIDVGCRGLNPGGQPPDSAIGRSP